MLGLVRKICATARKIPYATGNIKHLNIFSYRVEVL